MADGDQFALLLDYLKRTRGFDFSGYKRPTLERRIAKRLEALEVDGYAQYVDYLEVHPDEYELLFDVLLINVTSFFRDPTAWAHLREHVLRALLERKPAGEPIRVWCAGCATGEEAYSAAILLHQVLGGEEYRKRVKIYGTDLDEGALGIARHAVYTTKQIEGVPEKVLETYFQSAGGEYTFRPDLRRTVIFGRSDLVQDAPISRVDLLICRNALIYFTAETQNRILDRLHFALREQGVLFVGKSELLIRHSERFDAIDLKQRIFRKRARMTTLERYAFVTNSGDDEDGCSELPSAVRETVLDVVPVAQLTIDAKGVLVLVNRQARALLGLRRADVGRPLHDLEVSYRPAELRGPMERAFEERRPIHVGKVDFQPPNGELRSLDIEIGPLVEGGAVLGASITFADVTEQRGLRDQLERARRELSGAQEELQSTVEELETTNEELQSTNEELETTNEELQSTNEELETTNEELHSVNAELETTNDELRARGKEIDQVNAFLETILTSMGVVVMVVDRRLRLQIWNDQAEELWGLRSDEVVGQSLLDLDIGLPVKRLQAPIRACLDPNRDGKPPESLELDATNRRGKPMHCLIRCMPLSSYDDSGGVVVLVEATPA
jgi:two-component system, chemotaxis family, CheB/CheR fusion protein